jgi:hypothetical protein
MMNDLEATRLCAEAMDFDVLVSDDMPISAWPKDSQAGFTYDPLHDDAQMAALVKFFHLHIDQRPGKHVTVQDPHFEHLIERPEGMLNEAVVYCAAKMQAAKK